MPGLGVALRNCALDLGGRRVLQETSLVVAPGEKWLLCGPNGAGKTQLVKLLAGVRWPAPTGRESRRYLDGSGRELELVEVRSRIAYLGAESQDRYARHGWNHRIDEVVATGLFGTDIPLDRPDAAQRRRVDLLLRRVGLHAERQRRVLEVSYGQRRLALVARALAARPRLLLLDEIFNGLDAGHRNALARVLAGIVRTRVTLLLTAHRPEDVPAGLSHGAWIERGRLRRVSPRQAIARLGGSRPVRAARTREAGTREPPYIELVGASVYREGRLALRGIDWALRDGEHWAVTGRNGSGKSTFLGVLHGAYPVALGGRISRRGVARGTPLDRIRSAIGFVSPELQAEYEPRSTLAALVVGGLRGTVGLDRPMSRAERLAAVRALRRVGLASLAGRRAREVSYGELRLALIARAWVHEPQLLLLDEPFTGLDPRRRAALRRALELLARRGTRLVMAVHHRDDLPAVVSHRLHLVKGVVRESGRLGPVGASRRDG